MGADGTLLALAFGCAIGVLLCDPAYALRLDAA
jgi:hypothetical protein